MEDNYKIKCVIWDLDNTLWTGTLSEGEAHNLKPGVADAVKRLDQRGIIQSICSKNETSLALDKLADFGLLDYFLCPQISWNPKSEGVNEILKKLNIKPNATAFIDDSIFEREEVLFAIPEIHVFDEKDVDKLIETPPFLVEHITKDSSKRRMMYKQDLFRDEQESLFAGSHEEFLKSCEMKLTISPVTEDDLYRVEELTKRTHQLNSTGCTFSFDELRSMIASPNYILRICGLTDKYGDSGKVGIILIEKGKNYHLKLLIVSCRVMTRGIGSALLCYATQVAHRDNKKLVADFKETPFNRIMYITYKLSGFVELAEETEVIQLLYRNENPMEYPSYLQVESLD